MADYEIFNESFPQPVAFANATAERPYWMNVLDKASMVTMTINLIILMLGMGATTQFSEIWYNMKRPLGCLIGMACQFVILPAFGYTLCYSLQLSPIQALGVLILTCSPGGAFSNFFSYWVDGDLALSILMTATSSLLAFGAMPLNLWLYTSRWTSIDDHLVVPYQYVFISMCFVTLPAIVGMIVRHYTITWANRLSMFCGILGWIGALATACFLGLIYWDTIQAIPTTLLLTAAIVPSAGFIFAFILAKIFRQSNKCSRTIGIEAGCQNMVVAINVILFSYPDPKIKGEMLVYPITYGICQLVEIVLAIICFQIYRYIHRDDVTEETITSVIDNSILTHVPMMQDERNAKGRGAIIPDVIVKDPINTDINYIRIFREGREQVKEESLPLIPIDDLCINFENMPLIQPHERDGGATMSNSFNTYSEVENPTRERISFKLHKLETSTRESNEIPSTPDPTPRSPSLSDGYKFQTFGGFKRR